MLTIFIYIQVVFVLVEVHGQVTTYSTVSPGNPGNPVKCTAVGGKPIWCACEASTSHLNVDLTSIAETNIVGIRNPRFVAKTNNGWYIAWSPCNDFDVFDNETLHPSEGDIPCYDAGFALFTNLSNKECFSYGSHKTSAQLITQGGLDDHQRIKLFMIFKKGRSTIVRIHLKCDEHSTSDVLTYDGDHSGVLHATFRSKCCCEGACGHGFPPSGDSSWIVWLIAGVGLAFITCLVGYVARRRRWCRRADGFPVQVVDDQPNEQSSLI